MLPTRYASFFKRFIAHLVDVFLANLLTALLVIPVALMFVSGGILSRFLLLQPWDLGSGTDPEEILELIVEMIPVPFVVMWIVIFASLYWLYFAIFESSPRQATPGKMMLGIFVTDIYGRRISFLRALAGHSARCFRKLSATWATSWRCLQTAARLFTTCWRIPWCSSQITSLRRRWSAIHPQGRQVSLPQQVESKVDQWSKNKLAKNLNSGNLFPAGKVVKESPLKS